MAVLTGKVRHLDQPRASLLPVPEPQGVLIGSPGQDSFGFGERRKGAHQQLDRPQEGDGL